MYSTDQGKTWNQFTSTHIELQYVSTIHFKSTVDSPVVQLGTTNGGSDIGTIANAELTYITTGNETVYITTPGGEPSHGGGI